MHIQTITSLKVSCSRWLSAPVVERRFHLHCSLYYSTWYKYSSAIACCSNVCIFFGAFAKLRKATIASYCPSACLFAWNSSTPTGRIFMEFNIWVFLKKLSRRLKWIMGTLHQHQYTFSIISRSFLRRMWNVSDRSCREDQNTHLTLSDIFPKIILFMRWCGEI
jgi:hypothetical protein